MTLFLDSRDQESREQMDRADCDTAVLNNTYRQFYTINSLISRWKTIYKKHIRPALYPHKKTTLLDIGFGGGDIPIRLARWANKDGLNLNITAVDPDSRALQFVQGLEYPPNLSFLQCRASEITEQFDFVISNHLIHHLTSKELSSMLPTAKQLSRQKVIFSDLRRSNWAYWLFKIFSAPVFHNSFITEDGLTSIRRSYTVSELKKAIPHGWKVTSQFPFRLLLTFSHD